MLLTWIPHMQACKRRLTGIKTFLYGGPSDEDERVKTNIQEMLPWRSKRENKRRKKSMPRLKWKSSVKNFKTLFTNNSMSQRNSKIRIVVEYEAKYGVNAILYVLTCSILLGNASVEKQKRKQTEEEKYVKVEVEIICVLTKNNYRRRFHHND
ncbi:hypothetical protein Fmac_018719 [Flemingia macrophylla]|uniref:Uncharacterized protein n=1 Tax=Flemingia macrophylla TaxID=520843 RepID=A0ABD1M5U4_9FABA